MAERAEVAVPVGEIGVRRAAQATIAVVGNPNAGKSSLFNRLTGMSQKTANYPGVTVERRIGRCETSDGVVDLVDLPGTYSLTANSADERIAVGVLFGRVLGTPRPDGIVAVIDATRLYQGLYLAQQLATLGLPLIVALTMGDVAEKTGLVIDYAALGAALGGVEIFPVVATTGKGFSPLIDALGKLPAAAAPRAPDVWPELDAAVDELDGTLGEKGAGLSRAEIARTIIEGTASDPDTDQRLFSDDVNAAIERVRESLFHGEPPLATEARKRYAWIRTTLEKVESQQTSAFRRRGAALIEWSNQPWPATILFLLSMAIVFQAVFAWATIFMDAIEAGMSGLGVLAEAWLPEGMLASFVVDGVIAGVGSVIVFLPQILILFLFIIALEDSGYLARAAFLFDRAMRSLGLSGQSIIPLLSSFACAVPSIMATRVIPNRRDRIATILASPFMTCSARLPVYALLIAAFVPAQTIFLINLQGLVLFGLYMIGILGGIGTALLLKSSALRGEKPTFILSLPEFRMPSVRNVAVKLLGRVSIFLRRAGTIIFTVAVIVWALAFFPRSELIEQQRAQAAAVAEQSLDGEALTVSLGEIDNAAAAAQLEQSLLGRAGQFVQPVFSPLGWDWRVSAAVIASFPAREVVIAVLGTIYALGTEADEERLAERLRSATWPDGSPIYSLPMVLGLLIFYAWCLQCAATLAVIRRETNSWRWPVFAWVYMTALGYLGALAIFQLGSP